MRPNTNTRAGRIFSALLLLIVAFSCAAVQAFATRETLTVGVPTDRCPMFYPDAETGEIVGIGVDLMRAAAEEAGFAVEFRAIKEKTLRDALDNGEYDLVMPFGSALNSASGKPSVVSENLFQTPFTLVTAGKGNLPPLNALRVGMLRSLSSGAETVRQLYPGIEIRFYETMADCVKAVRNNEVDALLHNSYVWSYVLQKPTYHDLSVQPTAMFAMDFRAATPDAPEGRALIDRLNAGIATLTDTQRQAVILDHTSRRLYQYDLTDYLQEYGLIVVLALVIVASVVIISVQQHKNLRMQQEEKMRKLIDHDPLTEVYSMEGFRKRMTELLREHPDIPYLLSYNNIKNFKYINDSLGRAAGDALLRFWVNRTRETLSDEEAIGRVTADRFVVLRRAAGDEQLLGKDRQVIDSVRNYFIDQGKEIRVQVCTGVYVVSPSDYAHIDVDHMLDMARIAEKKVRETLKDGFEFSNPEEWERGKRVADVFSHFSRAIQTEELQVWYQPQVNYDTGEITGAEALCRWNHAKLGWLRPAEFIPLLEEAGLIYDLDRFVWDRVCRDLQRWNQQGIHRSVSVNLSRRDIREDRNTSGQFFELIQKYGLSPDQLHIEITETAFAENPELLIGTTVKLREFGFQVEMDDFGSGYSSLHMLKEVPVDRIKLDLHFLTGKGDPERGRIIVTDTVRMVHNLGMNLIAEGVENVAQARFLQGIGCAEMQGFYFYKPMPVREFEALTGQL